MSPTRFIHHIEILPYSDAEDYVKISSMYYLLSESGRSVCRQVIKLLGLVTLGVPMAAVISCALILGVLGSLSGQPGTEIALDFLRGAFDADALEKIARSSLLLYVVIVLYFCSSRDWLGTSAPDLLPHSISSRMMRLVRLWSSTRALVCTEYLSPNVPHRQLSCRRRTTTQESSYLAFGDTPQLE